MKILIVKLGAMGDVLRTTPLLEALGSRYPGATVTWVVDQASETILEGNPLIQEILVFEEKIVRMLNQRNFDVAMNLDKEPEALDAMEAAKANVKLGFGWNAGHDGIRALNPQSDYAVRLGLDDELKFRLNRKTYQEISFEQVGLTFNKEEYQLKISQEIQDYAVRYLQDLGVWGKTLVGLNTGSGDRFAGKRLPPDSIAQLARELKNSFDVEVLLLGGPEETKRNVEIAALAKGAALNAGTHHSILQFAAIVQNLSLVITGDTIAMHVAIATKVPLLVFFGATSAPEIELYGRGCKIVSRIECAPCYKKICPIEEKCMTDMKVDDVMGQVGQMLEAKRLS